MNRKDCDNQRHRHRHCSPLLARWFAGGMAVLCCAPQVGAATVRLRSNALIDGRDIRLADIAVLAGFSKEQSSSVGELVVDSAPAFGHSTTVQLSQVRTVLENGGVNLASVCLKGASRCEVRRPARLTEDPETGDGTETAAAQTLRGRITAFLSAKLREYGGKVEIDFGRAPAALLGLSSPAYDFELRLLSRRPLGAVEVEITVRSGAATRQVHTVDLEVGLRKKVVVAARALARGQLLTNADVRLDERLFSKFEDIGVEETAAVVGQETRRALHVGEMFETADIRSKVLIKRNDLVHVRSNSGHIEVIGVATALQNGTLGEVIEVANKSSGEAYWIRVTGLRRGEAVVRSAGPRPESGGQT